MESVSDERHQPNDARLALVTVTKGTSMTTYDPFSREARRDPYPQLETLRRTCPVHIDAGTGMATVARWTDVQAIVMDPVFWSSGTGPGPEQMIPELAVMVSADDPDHAEQRRIVARYYSPRRVAQFRPRIVELAHECIDEFADRGWCEFADEFAYAFPIRVVGEFLGLRIDPAEVPQLKQWQINGLKIVGAQSESDEAARQTLMEFGGWVLAQVQERRTLIEAGKEVPDDPLTALISFRRPSGEGLGDFELLGVIQQLLNHETTAAMFMHGVVLLAEDQANIERLRAEPALWDQAIEEILRYRAPVPGLCRTPASTTSVAGTQIDAGTKTRVMFASANHDDEHWEDPSSFRIDRPLDEVRRHLSFGAGIHVCLGAPLARAEARIGFEALYDRLDGLRLDPEHLPIPEDDIWVVHTYRSVRILWDHASPRPVAVPAR